MSNVSMAFFFCFYYCHGILTENGNFSKSNNFEVSVKNSYRVLYIFEKRIVSWIKSLINIQGVPFKKI